MSIIFAYPSHHNADGKSIICNLVSLITVIGVVILMMACSGPKRPMLYPNEHFLIVGTKAAQRDIDKCLRFSDQIGSNADSVAQTAITTAASAEVGAAIGAPLGKSAVALPEEPLEEVRPDCCRGYSKARSLIIRFSAL